MFFTPKLSWTKTQQTLAMQGTKALACILRFQKTFGHIEPTDMFKIFDTMVKPILCYGSEIWGYRYAEKIERVQVNFCKQYCNLSQNTANALALGECGRLPLYTTYVFRCIKYWIKLIRMENHRYPKQCYEMLNRLDAAGRNTWATSVKDVLYKYGFGYAWISQDVGDDIIFLHMFQQRLKDCCLQNWHENVNGMSKSLHYRHFKSLLSVETYLKLDLSYKLRRVLANFRCSSHVLMIEKGRHLGLDRNMRLCNLCQDVDCAHVEDEFHFFLECPEYEHLREFYFKPDWLEQRSIHKFYSILSSDEESDIIAAAKYLQAAFSHRSVKLSN